MKFHSKLKRRLVAGVMSAMMLFLTIPTSLTVSAQSPEVPQNMLNNKFLDALAYTGYDVKKQIKDETIYKEYGASGTPKYIRSNISYGTGPSGYETTSSKKPDISYFEKNGLCCASYVTYVYFNYLPNIAGIDVSGIAKPDNPRAVSGWENAVNSWVKNNKAKKISFTQDNDGSLHPSSNIPIGSIILFKNASYSYAHVAIYAGYYNGHHFVTHVGGDEGPVIQAIDSLKKFGEYESVKMIVTPPTTWFDKGSIEIYKKDINGKNLSGATFKATNTKDSIKVYYIGPTDSNGYAISEGGKNEPSIPYGTYTIVETKFPKNYEASGKSSWTVTLDKNTPNHIITINAINKLKTGELTIKKSFKNYFGESFTASDATYEKVQIKVKNGTSYIPVKLENAAQGTYKYDTTSKNTVMKLGTDTHTITIKNLPYGNYSIFESGDNEITQRFTCSSKTVAFENNTASVTLTNTEKNAGKIEIKKTLIYSGSTTHNDKDVLEQLEFTVYSKNRNGYLVVNSLDDGNYSYRTFVSSAEKASVLKITNGFEFIISSLPVGEYIITESKNAKNWTAISKTETVKIDAQTIVDNKTQTVNFVNTQSGQSLSIAKKFVDFFGNEQTPSDNIYSNISFNIQRDGDNPIPVTLIDATKGIYKYDSSSSNTEIKLGTESHIAIIQNMPRSNAPYFVYEISTGDAKKLYQSSNSKYAVFLNSDNSTSNSVTVINQAKNLGELQVTKTLKYSDGQTHSSAEDKKIYSKLKFRVYNQSQNSYISATATNDGNYTYNGLSSKAVYFTIKNGNSFKITNLPIGKYRVIEVNSDSETWVAKKGYYDIEITEDSVVNGKAVNVEFINTEKPGDLVITKEFVTENTDGTLSAMDVSNEYFDILEFAVQDSNGKYVTPVSINANSGEYDGKNYIASDKAVYFKLGTDSHEIRINGLPTGTYKIIERMGIVGVAIKTVDGKTQSVDIESGKSASIEFQNTLIMKELQIHKTSYDNMVEGMKFQLTSDDPAGIKIIKETDKNGYIKYEGLLPYHIKDGKLIKTTYTIKEVNVSGRYIVPNAQTTTLDNITTILNFYNAPKTGSLRIIKTAEDNEIEGRQFTITSSADVSFSKTLTTDANGYATIDNLPVYFYNVETDTNEAIIYTVKEWKTPDKYIIPAVKKVTLTADETVDVKIYNQLKKGVAELIKINSENNKEFLEGAEFTLYDINHKAIESKTTDSNGYVSFEQLVYGNYFVKETKAPEGYVIDNTEYPINITKNGQIVKIENAKNVGFVNFPIKGNILVVKSDDSKTNRIEGAEFTLYDSEGNIISVKTTDKFGEITFKDLLIGSYIVKETNAPEGYICDDNEYTINIDTNGKTYTVSNEPDGKLFLNKPIKGSICIIKTDEAMKLELAGAEFTLYDNNKEAILTKTTGIDGNIVFENLVYGNYFVKETKAPEGYIIDNNMYEINIDTDGKMYSVSNVSDNTVFINIPIRGNISVIKTNEDKTINLEGAEFTLYDSNGNVVKAALTDKNGSITFKNLIYGKYIIKETKAPIGFAIDKTGYPIDITENGKTYVVSNEDTGKFFINKPSKGKLHITKVDVSNGKLLPNCGVAVYDENGNAVVKGKTDKNGVIEFTLSYGKYYYQEFEAPEGYLINEEKYYFEIKENGEIIKAKMTDEKIPDDIEPTPKPEEIKSNPIPDVVQTGDNFAMVIELIILSAVSFVISVFIYKKRKNDR